MRLLETERQAIKSVLHNADPKGKVFLFGSRVDDNRKGGDIDIFFESTITLELRKRLILQYELSSECDNKIDLLVKAPNDDERPIYSIARKGVIL